MNPYVFGYKNMQYIVVDNTSPREKQQWLKYSSVPKQLVDQKMKETRSLRMSWIHGTENPSVSDIFETYPRYADHDGHLWVRLIFLQCMILLPRKNIYNIIFLI